MEAAIIKLQVTNLNLCHRRRHPACSWMLSTEVTLTKAGVLGNVGFWLTSTVMDEAEYVLQ